VKLLLDTNVLLWLLNDDNRLGPVSRKQITNASEIAISEVSLWEISIKISISKLKPIPALLDTIRDLGFRRLSIEDKHLLQYDTLPMLHRDPFDRMLIAQAKAEDYTLLTGDEFLEKYDLKVIVVS
jgi:PIN domain nuclease of toxin-antitoxin system